MASVASGRIREREPHVQELTDGDGLTIKKRHLASGANKLKLVVMGDGVTAQHALSFGRTMLLGRSRDADISIDHGEVSRRHLRLFTGPPMRIQDLGSANGTAAFGRVLSPEEIVEITVGEPIWLGSVVLVVRWDDAREEPDPPRSERPIVLTGAAEERARLVERVARSRINVLISGETGAGKEVLAETLHAQSPRAGKPFLRLNCGAISEALVESELFGHEKGAFTGALTAKPGLLESAEGGTILLDEIGELPLSLQVKLLRVLEERRVRRVGGLVARPIDVRFMAATNRDLEREVAQGTFRQDLYFRLNGITLTVPPLRERGAEIEELAEQFLEDACTEEGHPGTLAISADARAFLRAYPWPGNVRELRNVMERAVLLARGDTIRREHLPPMRPEMAPRTAVSPPPERAMAPSDSSSTITTELACIPREPTGGSGVSREHASVSIEHTSVSPERASGSPERAAEVPYAVSASNLREEIQAIERQRIIVALERCAGNQTHAARLLGISRGTLLSRLALYGLPRPRSGRRSSDP
ncbi:MAG: sigma 54-interacting transcriptional regulator [Polyangiaceae bacterium]